MFIIHIHRSRHIPHGDARVTLVNLLQVALAIFVIVLCRRQTNRVIEDPLGAVADLVFFRIAGQSFGVLGVVGRQVAVTVHQNGEHHVIRGQKSVLEISDRLIKVSIVCRAVLRNRRTRQGPFCNLLIVSVKQLLLAELATRESLLQNTFDPLGANLCQGACLDQHLFPQNFRALVDDQKGRQNHNDGQNTDQGQDDLYVDSIYHLNNLQ